MTRKIISLVAVILFTICSVTSVAQVSWDPPGFDDFYHLYYPNDWARLFKGGGPYPYTPYRTEYYRPVNGDQADTAFTIPFIWNHNNVCCTIGGDTQLVTSSQGFLGVPYLWSLGLSGQGIKIGVLDLGYSGLIPHRSITVQGSYGTTMPGHVEYTTAIHTAGVISILAARPQNGSRMLGTAYNSEIYSASILDIAGSLNWLINIVHCDIIVWPQFMNSSTIPSRPDSATIALCQQFENKGGALFISAGNTNYLDTINIVASVPGAFVVGDLVGGGSLDILDSFKHKTIIPRNGKGVDFVAPSLSVCAWYDYQNIGGSTSGGDGLNFYSLQSGTSFSSPNVAGYVALLLEYYRKKYPCYPARSAAKAALRNGRVISNLGYNTVAPTSNWVLKN